MLLQDFKFKSKIGTNFAYIMTDKPELPSITLSPSYSYETLLIQGDPAFAYAEALKENFLQRIINNER